jgi:16S rRNA (adenine1518-N6/adenine1519-N6)-dimethyltransferase
MQPKKSLGQHWLNDQASLEAMVEVADISNQDTVLEIGPGLGYLTELLIKQAKHVIAVELDEVLAASLASKNLPNLDIRQADILQFDLTSLPVGYKVAANIPYYLTSNLLRVLAESPNPPLSMALLLQKEVAERVAAKAGDMSLLSVSVQLYYEPTLGPVVPARLFTPPPKVDSQILALKRRTEALFSDLDEKIFFQVVKAGFANRRKKLRSSLSAGLRIDKDQADTLLLKAEVDGGRRPQELSLVDWYAIYKSFIEQ